MSTELNQILQQVAAGEITADQAAERIQALRDAEPSSAVLEPVSTPAEIDLVEKAQVAEIVDEVPVARRGAGRRGARRVERLSLRVVGRRVRVIGDSSVATVAAEGPHMLRRQGDVMELTSDGEITPSLEGFSVLRPPKSFDELRAMSLGKELVVRVNPSIVVDVEITAGKLVMDKVPYLGRVRVTAGQTRISHVAEMADVLIQAGSAHIDGAIRTGRSRVRCESGSLTVALHEDSDCTVTTGSQLGRVVWQPAMGAIDEYLAGDGLAKLDLSVVMGLLTVKVPDEV